MQVSDLGQEQTTVRDTCCALLGWSEEEGYVPLKLDILNTKISDVEAIVLTPQHCEEIFGQGENMDNELDMINMLLFVQDNHEFATIYPLI